MLQKKFGIVKILNQGQIKYFFSDLLAVLGAFAPWRQIIAGLENGAYNSVGNKYYIGF